MYKHILIPTDGSKLSHQAVVAGVKLAKRLGAKVTGFFAAPPPTPIVYKRKVPVGYMPMEAHRDAIKKMVASYLGAVEKEAKRAGVRYKGVSVTSDFPAEAILAAARKNKCDVIVMSSHGHRGLKGMLLGSVTNKVVNQSKIPVLVHR